MKNNTLATSSQKNMRSASFPRIDWQLECWTRTLAEWLREVKNAELQDASFASKKSGLTPFFAVKCKAMEYA